jgi:hypothetical protein
MSCSCGRCSLHNSHRKSCPSRLQVELAVGARDTAGSSVVAAFVVQEDGAEAVQEAHSALFHPLSRVSGARMLAKRHCNIQVRPQALPIAPGSRSPSLDLHQTCSVASSPTFAYSGQTLAALDRTDGAAVVLGRLLRSWEVVFG